jgi:hypothetical protein
MISGLWRAVTLVSALFLASEAATAQSVLTPWASLPSYFRSQISNDGLFVKGVGVDTWYALEVNPATGELPVTGSFTFSGLLEEDHNYGVVGADTLRTAAQIGNATGAADFGAGNYSAQTLRTVIASNQPSIAVTQGGKSTAALIYNSYSSTPVTTGSYVQLVASTSSPITQLIIFDSSGSAMILGVGGSGSEVAQLYVPPGGSTAGFSLAIPSGSRIAYKALDANATSGELIITGLD